MRRFTRIIGHMVTRNERDRYFAATLRWLRDITDVQHIYDDRSNDGTPGYAARLGALVDIRQPDQPTFLKDESAYRANAWRAMEERTQPSPADWILCVDADEFVVAPRPADTRETLTRVIEQYRVPGGVVLNVAEVFGFDDDNTPLRRVDGFWGQIQACRLVRWRSGAYFAVRPQGGGSVPAEWSRGAPLVDDLTIMHVGYARPQDRRARYERYRIYPGHNPSHVASILHKPSLVRWEGMHMTWPRLRSPS